VQGGLADAASSPDGLNNLMQLLAPPAEGAAAGTANGDPDIGSMLNSIMGVVTGQSVAKAGNSNPIISMVTALFGSSAMTAITTQLDKSLGFKVSALIPIVASLVIGTLRKMTQEQSLDAAAVAKMLQDEQNAFLASGSKEAAIVQDAVKAGQDAAALRGKFTPDEWTKIRLVPMAASALIIIVAPSNAVGVGHEVGASMQAVAEGHSKADPASLVNIVFDTPFTDDERLMVQKLTTKDTLLSTVREGASIVGKNAADQKAAYGQIIMSVAQAAAQAASEGGLMGFGSKRVNHAEQVALDEIAAVFK
jgi:hypothetical protein